MLCLCYYYSFISLEAGNCSTLNKVLLKYIKISNIFKKLIVIYVYKKVITVLYTK